MRNSTMKSRSQVASMELEVTPPENPSSSARKARSIPMAFPASAPDPRGQRSILGIMPRRRLVSRWRGAMWDMSQWERRMGCAGCRWVYPAVSTWIWARCIPGYYSGYRFDILCATGTTLRWCGWQFSD